jgi:hypothetical protein
VCNSDDGKGEVETKEETRKGESRKIKNSGRRKGKDNEMKRRKENEGE